MGREIARQSSLACVVNVSEGRDEAALDWITDAAGASVLDRHSDPDHHRAVFTLASVDGEHLEAAVRDLVRRAVSRLDLADHRGVHPRLGTVDVVPFVPIDPTGAMLVTGSDVEAAPADAAALLRSAVAARDRFCEWAASELGVPCFVYGPERSLPDVRRLAFRSLTPDFGPTTPHPRAGAVAVGARPALIAYNVWLATSDVGVARSIATRLRGDAVRALGFSTGGQAQVSCNLIAPGSFGPADAVDRIVELAEEAGTKIERTELVGLLPRAVLAGVPRSRWQELDLAPSRTFEQRLDERRAPTARR